MADLVQAEKETCMMRLQTIVVDEEVGPVPLDSARTDDWAAGCGRRLAVVDKLPCGFHTVVRPGRPADARRGPGSRGSGRPTRRARRAGPENRGPENATRGVCFWRFHTCPMRVCFFLDEQGGAAVGAMD